MPTFHNPTGLTLPEEDRRALLDMARRFDLMVLEDDAYHDLHYDTADGPLPPSLYALDTEGRVIRTGTFSKILAPGMRLGWAMAQPEVSARMVMLKEEGGTSPFSQQVAYEFCRDGRLDEYIDMLVAAYRGKRDAMLAALDRYFPSGVAWTRPAGGFFVWVTLPPQVDPDDLQTLARDENVDYLPGSSCFADPTGDEGPAYMRLSFSNLPLDKIEEAIKRLGLILNTLC
jgi:2-aminoadipate transaminase